MPRPLSNDLRERIVRVVDGGMSRNAAAQKYDVSISAVVKLMQRWRATDSYLPGRMGGWRKHLLAKHSDKVNALVAPFCYLREIKVEQNSSSGSVAFNQGHLFGSQPFGHGANLRIL
jgi:putative transposase